MNTVIIIYAVGFAITAFLVSWNYDVVFNDGDSIEDKSENIFLTSLFSWVGLVLVIYDIYKYKTKRKKA